MGRPVAAPAALPVELRTLGRVTQTRRQRSDRVRLGVVLGEVFVDQLAERGEVLAADGDRIAAAPRLDVSQRPLEEPLRLRFTLPARAERAAPWLAGLVSPSCRPPVAALGERPSLCTRRELAGLGGHIDLDADCAVSCDCDVKQRRVDVALGTASGLDVEPVDEGLGGASAW